jgi:hypothetical protein
MIPATDLVARIALNAVAALVAVCILLLAVLLVILIVRSRAHLAREAARAAARPVLQKYVVEYLAGSSETDGLRRYLANQRGDVAEALLLFQGTVSGSARDRLCSLALDFALVHDWCEEGGSRDPVCRRAAFSRLAFASAYEPVRRVAGDLLLRGIEDPDEEVRLAAARGLLQSDAEEKIVRVFALAIGPNLLSRVVLIEGLRRHAMELCAGEVRAVLCREDLPRIRAVLEILVAWERAMPLEDVREFLDHRDRGIRVLAFRLVPLVAANFVTRLALVRALNDADEEIRTLAVIAVGRLKMADAMPELAKCMRDGDIDLARHAADAISAMPRGFDTLVELSASTNPPTARAASEALQRTRTNP